MLKLRFISFVPAFLFPATRFLTWQTQHHSFSFGDLHFLLNCFFWKQCIPCGTWQEKVEALGNLYFSHLCYGFCWVRYQIWGSCQRWKMDSCVIAAPPPPNFRETIKENKVNDVRNSVCDSVCICSMHVFLCMCWYAFQSTLGPHQCKSEKPILVLWFSCTTSSYLLDWAATVRGSLHSPLFT